MAEDSELTDDDIRGRTSSFFATLGIAERLYNTAIHAATARAIADPADAAQTPWRPIGGRNIGGRVRALAQDPNNPLRMYAGAALGGVFKSEDGGDTWAPLGRPEDSFPVGTLAIDAVNPNVIYVGTGEPVTLHQLAGPPPGSVIGFDGAAAGVGMMRCDQAVSPIAFDNEVGSFSDDAAAVAAGTLAAVRPGAADRYSQIVVDPHNSGRCWIASNTGLWRREPGPPVSYVREPVPAPLPVVANTQALPLGATVTDIVLGEVRAADGSRRYRLLAGMAALGVFRGIYDPAAGGNAVWEAAPLGNGLPPPSTLVAGTTHDRIRLAVCRSFPDHVYALIENGLQFASPDQRAVLNVFHSADGGNNWMPGPVSGAPGSPRDLIGDGTGITDGGQPWAHLVIEAHPDNPAIVAAGGINLALSRDFGASWVQIINWTNFGAGDRSQHGDQHALLFDAADPRRLWVGNDGGISMAPDIVRTNPLSDNNWRKRSHGIQLAQFNDIAVHPSYPFMIGGGLQDNATYISYGGESWYIVSDADGGQMAFEVNDPRTFVAPHQFQSVRCVVTLPTAMTPALGFYPLVQRRPINADLAEPNDYFAVLLTPSTGGATLFIPIVERHRLSAGHVLLGQAGGAAVSTDGGANYVSAGIPAASFGAGNTSALAYGNAAVAASTNWWVGTDRGVLLLRRNTGANPSVWNVIATPVPAGDMIARIAVHPSDEAYVAIATATRTAPFQGRVFLSLDRGANWADVSGLPPPPVAAPPQQALPPSPITSLVFDPQPAAAAPQVLYAGTLAGVYVVRNLPRRRSPAANARRSGVQRPVVHVQRTGRCRSVATDPGQRSEDRHGAAHHRCSRWRTRSGEPPPARGRLLRPRHVRDRHHRLPGGRPARRRAGASAVHPPDSDRGRPVATLGRRRRLLNARARPRRRATRKLGGDPRRAGRAGALAAAL
jgi:hypothetical protein